MKTAWISAVSGLGWGLVGVGSRDSGGGLILGREEPIGPKKAEGAGRHTRLDAFADRARALWPEPSFS